MIIEKNNEPLTAVSSNCAFCSKFTFAFRKKYYLDLFAKARVANTNSGLKLAPNPGVIPDSCVILA